jgi:hypothetical protein
MWHGTSSQRNPIQIATSEIGLDSRVNNLMGLAAGGEGIRFSSSASLAANQAYMNPQNNARQILLCFVIVGETTALADEKRTIPPNKPGTINPFDSVTSQDGNYVTIYDSNK